MQALNVYRLYSFIPFSLNFSLSRDDFYFQQFFIIFAGSREAPSRYKSQIDFQIQGPELFFYPDDSFRSSTYMVVNSRNALLIC